MGLDIVYFDREYCDGRSVWRRKWHKWWNNV